MPCAKTRILKKNYQLSNIIKNNLKFRIDIFFSYFVVAAVRFRSLEYHVNLWQTVGFASLFTYTCTPSFHLSLEFASLDKYCIFEWAVMHPQKMEWRFIWLRFFLTPYIFCRFVLHSLRLNLCLFKQQCPVRLLINIRRRNISEGLLIIHLFRPKNLRQIRRKFP